MQASIQISVWLLFCWFSNYLGPDNRIEVSDVMILCRILLVWMTWLRERDLIEKERGSWLRERERDWAVQLFMTLAGLHLGSGQSVGGSRCGRVEVWEGRGVGGVSVPPPEKHWDVVLFLTAVWGYHTGENIRYLHVSVCLLANSSHSFGPNWIILWGECVAKSYQDNGQFPPPPKLTPLILIGSFPFLFHLLSVARSLDFFFSFCFFIPSLISDPFGWVGGGWVWGVQLFSPHQTVATWTMLHVYLMYSVGK